MSTVMYLGHGAEIEDDAVRLSRRKREFDDDAARRSGQRHSPAWTVIGLVSGTSAAFARWRSGRPA